MSPPRRIDYSLETEHKKAKTGFLFQSVLTFTLFWTFTATIGISAKEVMSLPAFITSLICSFAT